MRQVLTERGRQKLVEELKHVAKSIRLVQRRFVAADQALRDPDKIAAAKQREGEASRVLLLAKARMYEEAARQGVAELWEVSDCPTTTAWEAADKQYDAARDETYALEGADLLPEEVRACQKCLGDAGIAVKNAIDALEALKS